MNVTGESRITHQSPIKIRVSCNERIIQILKEEMISHRKYRMSILHTWLSSSPTFALLPLGKLCDRQVRPRDLPAPSFKVKIVDSFGRITKNNGQPKPATE